MVIRKIVSIDEELCTGCGQCIPKCAEGALQIVDGKARIVKDVYCDGLGACLGECPQNAITIVEREAEGFDEKAVHVHLSEIKGKRVAKSSKPQWPVKLNLVPAKAGFFEGADILLAADCAPFAYPKLHETLMPGRRLMIGCTKFDDARTYAQKLTEILKLNNVASITIAHMEVPCCSGLKWAVDRAVEASGKKTSVKRYEITISGDVCEL